MLGFSVQKGGKEWHGSGLRRNRSASSCVRQKVGLAQEKPPETTASNGISDPTGAKRLKRPYDSSAGCAIAPLCTPYTDAPSNTLRQDPATSLREALR